MATAVGRSATAELAQALARPRPAARNTRLASTAVCTGTPLDRAADRAALSALDLRSGRRSEHC